MNFGLRRNAVRKIIRSESLSVNNLKSKIQNLKWVRIFAIAFTFAFDGAGASAQQPNKIGRVGFLDQSTASASAVLVEAFQQELSKLGWSEGKISPSSTDLPTKKMTAVLARADKVIR